MGVLHHGKVVELTAGGAMVTVPALAPETVPFGPCLVYGPEVIVGDSVLVGQIEDNKEDLVVVSGVDGSDLTFTDSVTIDFTKNVIGHAVDVTAIVKPNSIPLTDLSDTSVTSPVAGELMRYNGSLWINARALLDDLSDVVITSPSTGQVVRYNGSNWVNAALLLDDLSDAIITTPATGHVLRYNGTNWVNVSVLDFIVAAQTTDAITIQVGIETHKRLIINGNGLFEWGPGNSSTLDTNLYRSAADTLKTDDKFVAGANLEVTGTIEATSTVEGSDFIISPSRSVTAELDALKPGTVVAQLYRSSATTITNNGTIPWDAEDFDTYSGHSLVSNTDRYVFQQTGKYLISGIARHQVMTADVPMSTTVRFNGTATRGVNINTGSSSPSTVMRIPIGPITVTVTAAGTDYVDCTLGNNQATAPNAQDSVLIITYVGP